jgi:glycosyltransferase involved in cell wall biosynthesis
MVANETATEVPLVSVVIPAWNAARWLPATLGSLQAQTLQAWEAIVVEDGSTDDTRMVAGRIATKDPRIRVHVQANAGVSAARNTGFALARADFVCFLDADDLFLPQNLAQKVKALQAQPSAVAVVSGYEVFDSVSELVLRTVACNTTHLLPSLLEFGGPTGLLPSNVLLRRQAVDKIGGWDTRLSTAADQDFWIRLVQTGPVVSVPGVGVRYRLHFDQMHTNIQLMKHDVDLLYQKARQAGVFRSASYYRYCMARKSMVLAGCFWKDAHQPWQALREGLRAFGYAPKVPLSWIWRRLRH